MTPAMPICYCRRVEPSRHFRQGICIQKVWLNDNLLYEPPASMPAGSNGSRVQPVSFADAPALLSVHTHMNVHHTEFGL